MSSEKPSNVIRPQFGKSRPVGQEAQQEQAVPISEPEAQLKNSFGEPSLDEKYFTSNEALAFEIILQLAQFDSFIRSLRGYVQKDSNVALRRQSLKDFSLESLVRSVRASGENDWKLKPSYYRAVFEEVSSRISALREKNSKGSTRHVGFEHVSPSVREDCVYVLLNKETVRHATQVKSERATNFVFDELKGFVFNENDINLRREGLKQHRAEDLVKIMNASEKQEWAAHPHFYGAVILELDQRLKEVFKIIESVEKK